MRLRGFFVFILVIFLPAALFAAWPAFHANYQRNGQTDESGPLTPGIKWKFKNMDRYAAAVIGRNGVIYGQGADALYAVNANGEEKWRYEYRSNGFRLRSRYRVSIPAIAPDGTVYIVGVKQKAYLIALSGDSGAVKWSAEVGPYYLEAEGLSPIAVTSAGRVYVAIGNSLSAFNASGVKEWMYQLTPNFFSPTAPSLSPDEKTVYVYQRVRGGLYAINHDGALKWHDSSPYFTNFSSPAVAPDGTIYLVDGAEAKLHAITPEGKKKWTAHFSNSILGISNISLGRDGTVYMDTANDSGKGGAIYAVNHENGKVKWRFEIEGSVGGHIIAVDARENLYYAAGNHIYCLRPDGSLVWKYSVEGNPVFTDSSPAISDGVFYVSDEEQGGLFAIGAEPKK